MIKECIIKLNNGAVTVVTYDGIDVQFPAIHKEARTVFVNYENEKYTIVDKNFKSKVIVAEKKNAKKKTTDNEIAKDLESTVEDSENA